MIEILKKIPFFDGLSDEDLQQIAEKTQLEYFPADHMIFKQGDPGDKMYVIKRGEVQVIRENSILAVLKEGGFFGEMALVSDETRNADIKTVTDIELITLKKDDFKALLETNGTIASMVSYEVVKRSNVNN